MEAVPTGFKAHIAAEQAIHENMVHSEAIDNARLSPEVQQLNNIAQSEIWGTQGRTAGYLDPVTGEPLAAPIKGVINEIRENRRYGTTEAEREAKAQAYESDIQSLQEQDFELCQAKLIMDLRKQDTEASALMIAKKITGGATAVDAESAVRKIYAKKDAWRLKRIKEEGIFNAQGWDMSRAIHAEHTDPRNNEPDTTEILEPDNLAGGVSIDRALAWIGSSPELVEARAEYVRLSAGRSARGFRARKEFGKEAVEQARQNYEDTKTRLVRDKLEGLRATTNMTEAELDEYYAKGSVIEAEGLAIQALNERMIATGKWEMRDIHNPANGEDRRRLVKIEPEQHINKILKNTFLKMWGKKEGSKLMSKPNANLIAQRAAVVVAVPAVIGSAALSMPITLGVAGAYAANKVAKSALDYKRTSNLGKDEFWAQDAYTQTVGELKSEEDRGQDYIAGDIIDEQAERKVAKNRRNAVIRLGATAVGGAVGGVGGAFVKT